MMGNKILLQEHELFFDDEIYEFVCINDKVIVVFNTGKDDGYDNVYCYNYYQEQLWRIKQPPKDIGGTTRVTYVGVDFFDGICRVIDFFGRRFILNILNGEIVCKDIVK